jgi:hypothetical protein
MIFSAAIGPAARAGPQLRRGQRVAGPVVALDADDDSVTDVKLQQAAAAAVVGGAADAEDVYGAGRILAYGRFCAKPRKDKGGSADQRAPLKEAASRHGGSVAHAAILTRAGWTVHWDGAVGRPWTYFFTLPDERRSMATRPS